MNDALRLAIMLVVTNLLNVAVGFGLSISAEQVALLGGLIDSVLLLTMFFWKKGQEPGL